jgi:hypothetical protein
MNCASWPRRAPYVLVVVKDRNGSYWGLVPQQNRTSYLNAITLTIDNRSCLYTVFTCQPPQKSGHSLRLALAHGDPQVRMDGLSHPCAQDARVCVCTYPSMHACTMDAAWPAFATTDTDCHACDETQAPTHSKASHIAALHACPGHGAGASEA